MARKRRMFEIEMPEETAGPAPAPAEPAPETFPAGKEERSRRGPMATAISETVQSARERQELEARIRQENDALAHEHVRLKKLGLVMELVPLDAIETYKLTRDRAKGPDPELAELTESIRTIGLSNPIRLETRPDGRFELIQGYRRLGAYRALLEETGDAERWGAIPAAVAEPGVELEGLYRLMVDENLVRKDISFAEMAQLALDYAADPQTAESDPEKVVALLFKSAGYQKRSYIRNFIKLLDRLGPLLQHAPAIPRALGLALVTKLEAEPGLVEAIRAELSGWDNRSAGDEIEALRRVAGLGAGGAEPEPRPAPAAPKPAVTGKARTSFQIDRREGRAKCTAANGRLEVRLDRDFSMIDRRRLEQAVRQMLDQLD
ncbi:ParB/RepB/Spo0J family partition protein [Acidimangrovimonas pyrenivorans]|uniref:ParB/RepB/Spo0J family partition protein n=1 Tax=Acidimangrovimonas pyrenivorans TaxID=2030798 RepID=A0ABV7AN64_9RHOB